MAVLISGIGRSGTTTLYQILGKGFIGQFKNARCVYEPDLWDIPQAESTATVKGQPFNVGQVGLFNVQVHCKTPLFLTGRHMLFDAWLRRVYGTVPLSERSAPENVLVKVIRGSGRLEAALDYFQNLKVIIVTRNVVDTVNSGLGLFSFFGDEFHPSDKTRFVKEVNEHFGARLDSTLFKDELQWSVLWWHYFTEASIRTKEKFPERVMLLPYEIYMENQQEWMEKIFDFAGIDREFIDRTLFEQSAGPRTSVAYLNGRDVEQMSDEILWYFDRLKNHATFTSTAAKFRQDIIAKYSKREFVKSLLLTEKTDLTAVQWRIKLKGVLEKQQKAQESKPQVQNQQQPYTLSRALVDFGGEMCGAQSQTVPSNGKQPAARKKRRTLGVLVAAYNNENTIAETIYSVLAQSRRPELIVVADDCSTDSTVAIVKEIAGSHNEIHLIARPANVGVAANRDLAIRQMDTDYISTLDGDDLYMPGKLEREYLALEGALDRVAFSDIAVVSQKERFVQDTTKYANKSVGQMLTMLAGRSAPVPRDMMFSKALFEKAEGYDVGMDIYEDWAFKMRLMAVSSDNSWVHSNGLGTVYDRRSPGLSGKAPVVHAHGQLLAVARNSALFKKNPDALYGALNIIAEYLDGVRKKRLDEVITCQEDIEILINMLDKFWSEAAFFSSVENRSNQLNRFIDGLSKKTAGQIMSRKHVV